MSKIVKIPYGTKFFDLEVADEVPVLSAALDSIAARNEGLTESQIVRQAMDNPIASPKLAELARDIHKIVIIISDQTRAVPTKIILPEMLADIRSTNPNAEITLISAQGTHRPTTQDELRAKMGDALYEEFKDRIVIHNCRDMENHTYLGDLPSGAPMWLDNVGYNCDLLISEGYFDPHFYAGFSGGRKSILPGISSYKTIYANHCSAHIDNPNCTCGILEGNPIHRDMLAAARLAKLRFSVNVILDAAKKVIDAYAGDPGEEHYYGCKVQAEAITVKAVPADIVVGSNGGAPLDTNLYQGAKGIDALGQTAKQGAAVVFCASLTDGYGGADYVNFLQGKVAGVQYANAAEAYDACLKLGQFETTQDLWQAMVPMRVQKNCTVIVVNEDESKKADLEAMNFKYAKTLEEGMAIAYELKGKDASMTVVPSGPAVIIEK